MSLKLKASVFSLVPTAASFIFFRVLFFRPLRLFLSKDKTVNVFAIDICPAELRTSSDKHGNCNGFCNLFFACPLHNNSLGMHINTELAAHQDRRGNSYKFPGLAVKFSTLKDRRSQFSECFSSIRQYFVQ